MLASIHRSLGALLLGVAVMAPASAAVPGLVQGSQGWYEDIRFALPGSSTAPTLAGLATPSPCASMGCADVLSFNTVSAGRLEVVGSTLSAPGSTRVTGRPAVLQSGQNWQGLGVNQNGIVDHAEALGLSFGLTVVDVLGLTVYYSAGQAAPEITLLAGELPTVLKSSTGVLSSPAAGIGQVQWWFDQPIQTNQFTLLGSSTSYHLGAVQIAAVPEPETWAMGLAGLMVLGLMLRRPGFASSLRSGKTTR